MVRLDTFGTPPSDAAPNGAAGVRAPVAIKISLLRSWSRPPQDQPKFALRLQQPVILNKADDEPVQTTP